MHKSLRLIYSLDCSTLYGLASTTIHLQTTSYAVLLWLEIKTVNDAGRKNNEEKFLMTDRRRDGQKPISCDGNTLINSSLPM